MKRNSGGMFFFLDFKKAYDSLEWNFLYKALEKFNFGPSFIKWIKLMYEKPMTCIKNNGYISPAFTIERGVRQGCPISCLLFIIAIEALALSIKQSANLSGFPIGNVNETQIAVKFIQYADDGIMYIKNETEFQHGIHAITVFSKVSGLELNMEKCEGLWIGSDSHRQRSCNLFGIKWPTKPIKCLGIYVGHDKQMCNQLNWYKKIAKLEKVLNVWKQRELTLFGKVNIIKTLGISQLLYSAQCLNHPEDIVGKINSILFKFVWGGSEKLKRNQLIADLDKGGIKMIDIKSMFDGLKASWVNRCLKSKETDTWSVIPRKALNAIGSDSQILHCNFNNEKHVDFINRLPEFYQNVIMSYCKSKIVSESDFIASIPNQFLWGNRHITHTVKGNKQCLLFRHWLAAGIKTVGQLCFINGCLDENYIYEKVKNKRNILCEISIMKKALYKYRHILGSTNPQSLQIDLQNMIYQTSEKWYSIKDLCSHKGSFFYGNLKSQNTVRSKNEKILQKQLSCDIDFDCTYRIKICKMHNKKLSETNYKILHGILPCNKNLKKWKKKDSDKCDMCDETQCINHLLYECWYSDMIWKYVSAKLNVKIELKNVLLGDSVTTEMNVALSLICYIIYKDWLVQSLENKSRIKDNILNRFKNEIRNWYFIYKELQMKEIHQMLEVLAA